MQGGAATGSGGCNSYHATYETTGGDGLTFGPIGSTMMACSPRAVADQEQAYFATLGKVGTFAIEGDQLSLFDAGGQLLLGFAGRSGS